MPQETITQVEPKTEQKPKPIEFGDGRYSQVMKELFQDSQRLLGLSQDHAEKLAKSFGADLGRYAPKIEIKYGRVTKDGKMTLREASVIKGLTVTYPIALARATVLLQEATGFGVNNYSKVTLDKQFTEWLNK